METLLNNSELFINGFIGTVNMFLISIVASTLIGVIIGGMRISPSPSAQMIGAAYVGVFRNMPLALLMLFFALGYPKLGLPRLSYFTLATIALILYTAAYVCEVFRSGVNSIERGQTEAARAIGLRFGTIFSRIIVPQSFRAAVPALVNVYIALLKNTTVASGFSVFQAGSITAYMAERGQNLLITILWIAFFFLLLIFPMVAFQNFLEYRYGKRK